MKIGVTGYTGYVGRSLVAKLPFVPLHCDITVPHTIRLAIEQVRPDLIVNLACRSGVDYCEASENKENVVMVNVRGAYNVFDQAEIAGIPVVHLSTDHVFSGKWGPSRSGPYGERSKPGPVNNYGFSKWISERAASAFDNVKIVRTSRLFDLSCIHFEEQSYPTFIERSFMYLPHFIESLRSYVQDFDVMPKLLHISGTETTSWYNFMKDAFKIFGKDVTQVLRRTGEPDGYVPRPFHAGLKTKLSSKLGIPQFPYLIGLKRMWADNMIRELGYES